MSHILVIGAGLSGCTTALELAKAGLRVTLVEKGPVIGGRVRKYGCKATDKCNNCGVCLTVDLWEKVENHQMIEIIPSSVVVDLSGVNGDFSAAVKTPGGMRYLNQIDQVVVSTGFESRNTGISSHLQIEDAQGIITGTDLEAKMMDRGEKVLFDNPPERVAFIQCFGSRDKKEDSQYCSRVCCAYSSRAAKVMKQYDPDCQITFFYMEFQSVAHNDYFKELCDLGIEFVKCRPLKINGGKEVVIEYDDPAKGLQKKTFDMVVLSEGIHPTGDNNWMAETYGLDQDRHGFLNSVGDQSGIYVTGCAKTPLKIDESYAGSVAVAREILAIGQRCGGLGL